MQNNLLYVWIVATALSFAPCAEAETAGQEARTNAVIMAAENPHSLTQANTIQSNTSLEQILIQEKLDSFEKRADDLKWVITTTLAVIVVGGGLLIWKNQREYDRSISDIKECLRDAKGFARKAEESCSNSEEWERKSQAAFESIDTKAEEKLQELDAKAEYNIKKLFEEAKKQRDISRKWFDALNASQERDFELANKLWEEITQENPRDYEAFYHWSITLASEAEGRLSIQLSDINLVLEKLKKALEINPKFYQAFHKWAKALSFCLRNIELVPDDAEAEKYLKLAHEKYEQAANIKPDDYNIYIDWGKAYGAWAIVRGTNRELYSNLAEEKFREAEKIKAGSAAYFLASLWAERGNIENCKKWLLEASKTGTLPTLKEAQNNDLLGRVQGLEWFNKLHWKKEKDVVKEPKM